MRDRARTVRGRRGAATRTTAMRTTATRTTATRTTALITVAAVVALAAAVGAPAAAKEPPGATPVEMTPALRERIQSMIDEFRTKWGLPGISAAVVTPDAHGSEPVITTFVAGTVTIGGSEPVTETTQYELGSETKVFTADLLALLVASGEVALDDPVQQYAPVGVTVPTWIDPDTSEVTEITLRDLATHQAAFEDDPPNFAEGCSGIPDCVNPHPGYTQTMLWDAFDGYTLPWKPGTRWLYSNWGFGLLGTILANVVDAVPPTDPPAFQSALEGAFLHDLGLSATRLELSSDPRLAPPYDLAGQPAISWDNTNALAGGGGLMSNAKDMGAFVAAHLGFVDPAAPLGVRSMATTLQPVSEISVTCSEPTQCEPAEFSMGLAWQLYRAAPKDAEGVRVPWAFKNGGTAGSSTDTALAPSLRTGVTTMFNMERNPQPYDGIATAILALLVDSTDRRLPPTGSTTIGSGWVVGSAAMVIVALGVVLLTRRGARYPQPPGARR